MARLDPRNRTRYWRGPDPGLSLLRADFSAHAYGPHAHDGFVIAATEAGGAEITCPSGAEEVSPSLLFVSNPDEPQSARMGASTRWRYRALYLTRTAVDALLGDASSPGSSHFPRAMIADAALTSRIARAHEMLESDPADPAGIELLTLALGLLFQRHGRGGARPDPAPRDAMKSARIVALMRARYRENLALDDLAAAAGLTRFKLIGLFRRTIGLTPHAFLIRLRLDAARCRLRLGQSPAETAQAVGFCDQSALTKHFRRCYGITPGAYRTADRPR